MTSRPRKDVPATELDLRLVNSRIETLIPIRYDGASPVTGALVARARLTGSGNSVHKAFASANGDVVVAAPGGEIRKAFAELLGVSVRTLQSWEQGRKQPSGAARTLLAIASVNPKAVLAALDS